MTSYPNQVESVRSGNNRPFGFLTGQVLQLASKEGKGGQSLKVSPPAVAKRLRQIIQQAHDSKKKA